MKELFRLFDFSQKVDYKIEILTGLTVALALTPEAVAFSLIAGLSPLPAYVLHSQWALLHPFLVAGPG